MVSQKIFQIPFTTEILGGSHGFTIHSHSQDGISNEVNGVVVQVKVSWSDI